MQTTADQSKTLPYWPAAMNQKMAAAYCGISVETFKKVCPVKPIAYTQSTAGQRYLRQRIDEWLLTLDGNEQTPRRLKFGERLYGGAR